MKRYILLLALPLLLLGCASFNSTTFHTQKIAADTVAGSIHAYNVWLSSATNEPNIEPQRLQSMLTTRDQVYAMVRKFAAVEKTVNNLRLEYKANATDTTRTALQSALMALDSQNTNIVNLVRLVMANY